MAKNKSLKVLSTASVAGMVAAAVVSSQAFAAVDAYSVKVDNDVFQYSKADLTDSFLASKAGEAAPLYEDFLARFEKASGFYAFHDNKTEKYVSVADITEKYLEAKAAGTEFVVDTYTESKDAKVLEVPTVKKVVVKDGKVVIEEDQATLKVNSVSAINTNEVKVSFNKAVDTTKATFALKKGAANYFSSVAWNAEKTEATITATSKLPTGEYNVEVSGLTETVITGTVKVEDERVEVINITNAYVELKDAAELKYEVKNQYGKTMRVSAGDITAVAYNTTKGKTHTLTAKTDKFTFHATDFEDLGNVAIQPDEANLNDVIRVTLSYKGKTVSKDLEVRNAKSATEIQIGEVKPLQGKSQIFVGDTGLELPVVVTDQDGEAVKLSSYTDGSADNVAIVDGITFTSSNPSVVDVDSISVDSNGKVTFDAGSTDGTAIITAIVQKTGKVAQLEVKVNKAATVGELSLKEPNSVVASGDKDVKIEYLAKDQYGNNINAKFAAAANATAGLNLNGATISVISSNTSIIDPASTNISVNAKGELLLQPQAKGSVKLEFRNGVNVVGTLNVTVEEAATPVQIKSVNPDKKINTDLVQGKSVTVKAENFKVIDQYGRDYKLKGTEGIVAWMSDGSETYVDLSHTAGSVTAVDSANAASLTNDNTTSVLTVAGKNATGKEKVVFQLVGDVSNVATTLVDKSKFEVEFANTEAAASYDVSVDKSKYTADEDIVVAITAKKSGSIFTDYNQTEVVKVELDNGDTFNKEVKFTNGLATVVIPADTAATGVDIKVTIGGSDYEMGIATDGDFDIVPGALAKYKIVDAVPTTAGAFITDTKVKLQAVDADSNVITTFNGDKVATMTYKDADGFSKSVTNADSNGSVVITFTAGVSGDIDLDAIEAKDTITVQIGELKGTLVVKQ